MDFIQGILFLSISVTMSKSYTLCPQTPKAQDPTLKYFNLSDAYDVTWSHAVNNQSKLEKELASSSKMIEADVQMRHNRTDTEPIMAHPPSTNSDLTLAEFIKKVTASKKGIKLDFKSIMAVEPSLKLLKNVTDSKAIKNPIWLNADIVGGPCSDKVCIPVDPKRFIRLCQQYFPAAVLSIGWTTGNDVKQAVYSWSNVIDLGRHTRDISQPVSFPVRAALVKSSLEQFLWLLDLSRNFTLTVWSSDKDEVEASDLIELRSKVYNKKNVYYDLPKVQVDAFKNALERNNPIPNNPYGLGIKMKSYATASCTDVLVGETKLMFSGKGGWVSSVDEITSRYSRHINLEVSFLSLDHRSAMQNITVIVGSSGLFGATANLPEKDGIQMTLEKTGEFKVTSPDGKVFKSSGVDDPKSQYTISLWYGQSMDYVQFVVKSKADYRKEKSYRWEGGVKPSKRFVVIGVDEQQGGVLVDVSTAEAVPSGSGSWMIIPSVIVISLSLLIACFFT